MNTPNIGSILGRSIPQYSIQPDYNRPHHQTSVGIEVELEGVSADSSNFKRWDIVHDGSLHNGIEFVSVPVWGTAIDDALSELEEYLSGNSPNISFRTSVHVHINVLDMEADALARFIKIYIMYEKTLFRTTYNEGRYNNIFCIPCGKSSRILHAYGKMINDIRRGVVGRTYLDYKYSALNVNPVGNLGTIEFRQMGGTSNPSDISSWINLLLQMKVSAILDVDIDNPDEVFGELVQSLDLRDEDLSDGRNSLDYITLLKEIG